MPKVGPRSKGGSPGTIARIDRTVLAWSFAGRALLCTGTATERRLP